MSVDLSPESVRTIVREENAKREVVRERLRRSPAFLSMASQKAEEGTRRKLAREWRLSVQGLDT
jgi:hypothetical protein